MKNNKHKLRCGGQNSSKNKGFQQESVAVHRIPVETYAFQPQSDALHRIVVEEDSLLQESDALGFWLKGIGFNENPMHYIGFLLKGCVFGQGLPITKIGLCFSFLTLN